MIRLLIVDDHENDRDGLRLSLDGEPGIEVVGEAANGAEALEAAARLQPDVVLMDLRMPIMNGVEATKRLARLNYPPQVVALTTYDSERDVGAAMKAGAAGYLSKDAPTRELVKSIRGAAAAGAPTPQSKNETPSTSGRPAGGGILDESEVDVLKLIAAGFSNGQAAAKLAISEQQVKGQLLKIYKKLGVQDRSGAVGAARRHNIL